MGEIVTGNTPPTSDKNNYCENGLIWITPTDIESQVTNQSAKMLSEIGQLKARIVPAGTVLVTSIASIGKNTLLTTKGSFNQQINGVIPNKEYDSYFLLTQSYYWSKIMKNIAGAGGMLIVNKSDFSNIKIKAPLLSEQRKIGQFFQSLDTQISQANQKLSELIELKKAYLQQLFI